MAPRNLSTTF